MLKTDKEGARHYLLHYQGLDVRRPREQILSVFEQLHCIQVDPLHVIGRSHDLTLKARLAEYHPTDLEREMYERRSLMEGYDKMLSIYPVADRSFFHHVEQLNARQLAQHAAERYGIELEKLARDVRMQLLEGPLMNADVTKAYGIRTPGSYGGVHVLNYLYHLGEVDIVGKKHNHKIYALSESRLEAQPEEMFIERFILRRIESCGLIRNARSDAWLGHAIFRTGTRAPYIKKLLEQERILEVHIEGIKDHFLIPAAQKQALLKPVQCTPQVRFLAPLDNVMWDRDLIEQLFDFYYRWEVYVPKAKRQYGYYVLPILYGDRLIGRVEPRRTKAGGRFEIEHIWWENGEQSDKHAFTAEVDSFEHFLASTP